MKNPYGASMSLDKYLPPAYVHFLREDAGVTFTEYALVALLITVVCVIALLALRHVT